MKLSAEAAGEITSATGQAILTIADFAEIDNKGVDLVFVNSCAQEVQTKQGLRTQASRSQPLVSRPLA